MLSERLILLHWLVWYPESGRDHRKLLRQHSSQGQQPSIVCDARFPDSGKRFSRRNSLLWVFTGLVRVMDKGKSPPTCFPFLIKRETIGLSGTCTVKVNMIAEEVLSCLAWETDRIG